LKHPAFLLSDTFQFSFRLNFSFYILFKFINFASKQQIFANKILWQYLIRIFLKTKSRRTGVCRFCQRKHIFCVRRLLSANAAKRLRMMHKGLFEMKSNNQLGGKKL